MDKKEFNVFFIFNQTPDWKSIIDEIQLAKCMIAEKSKQCRDVENDKLA